VAGDIRAINCKLLANLHRCRRLALGLESHGETATSAAPHFYINAKCEVENALSYERFLLEPRCILLTIFFRSTDQAFGAISTILVQFKHLFLDLRVILIQWFRVCKHCYLVFCRRDSFFPLLNDTA
jgi:hypothetical protein